MKQVEATITSIDFQQCSIQFNSLVNSRFLFEVTAEAVRSTRNSWYECSIRGGTLGGAIREGLHPLSSVYRSSCAAMSSIMAKLRALREVPAILRPVIAFEVRDANQLQITKTAFGIPSIFWSSALEKHLAGELLITIWFCYVLVDCCDEVLFVLHRVISFSRSPGYLPQRVQMWLPVKTPTMELQRCVVLIEDDEQ